MQSALLRQATPASEANRRRQASAHSLGSPSALSRPRAPHREERLRAPSTPAGWGPGRWRAGGGADAGARARGRGQGGGAAELGGWAWRTAAAEATSGSGSGTERPCGTRAPGRGKRRGNRGRNGRVVSGHGLARARRRVAEAACPGCRRRFPRKGGGALGSPEVAPFVCLPRPLRPYFPSPLRPSPLPLSLALPRGPSGARSRPCFVCTRVRGWRRGECFPGLGPCVPARLRQGPPAALLLAEAFAHALRPRRAWRSGPALPLTPHSLSGFLSRFERCRWP